jgi:tetratricopeptide (TPR) repeat protein
MEASAPYRRRLLQLVALAVAGLSLLQSTGCHLAASGQNAQGARLFETGQYTAAMQEFQKALATDPTNADGYYNLARVTHHMGVQRKDAALTEQAESLYNQCLDHNPQHVDCYRSLAVLLSETGRPDKAFTLLKNWSASNPQLADARIELARLYEEFGEPQTAKKYLEDAVQQDPNSARAWLALAKMRESSGDFVQALANYQRSYSLNNFQPMVQERIAALSQQLSNAYDATLSGGGTRMAQPGASNNLSRGRY